MSSVFSSVYQLMKNSDKNKIEDYLSELFVPILNRSEILSTFFSDFLNENLIKPCNIKVKTQFYFEKLDHHDKHSIIDIVVSFEDNNEKYLLFIENKVSSEERYLQLKRYADHLAQHIDYKGFLVYLTKNYDPKDAEYILPNINSISFNQIRWREVYLWLEQASSDIYISEFIRFLEELKMDIPRKLTQEDMLSLQNFRKVFKMMDSCFDGEVKEKIKNIEGEVVNPYEFIGWIGGYMFGVFPKQKKKNLWIGCGFYIFGEIPTMVVRLAYRKKQNQNQFSDDLKKFPISHPHWVFKDEINGWCELYTERPISQVFEKEDHVSTIEQFFLDGLDKLFTLSKINALK